MPSYTNAALKGMGSYTNAALKGLGRPKKGSAEAKARMAYLRSLRKKKSGGAVRAGTIFGGRKTKKSGTNKLMGKLLHDKYAASKPDLSNLGAKIKKAREMYAAAPTVPIMG